MSVARPHILTVSATGGELVLRGDGEPICAFSPSHGLWLIARLSESMTKLIPSSQAAARSGVAGNGGSAAALPPALGT